MLLLYSVSVKYTELFQIKKKKIHKNCTTEAPRHNTCTTSIIEHL